MSKHFKFSVIMPIYNVEDYLEEAILSVVNQTIGFEDNIQLILVNDGSPDNSGEICKKYKELYPENTVYVEKENGGVSSARNLGIEYVEAKYVNFFDSDDKWEETAFEKAYDFFEEHFDETDVVSARIKFFEAIEGYHTLDYKFNKGARIANLREKIETFLMQSTTATTFIKSSAVGDIRFDSRLTNGEDSLFINSILLKKCKLGLLPEAVYLYRKREAGTSIVDKQLHTKSFYTDPLVYYHLALFERSKELYGEVLPFIQAMVAYDLMWRFSNPYMKETLNEEEQKVYEERVRQILLQIDDEIIMRQPRQGSIVKQSDAMYYKYGKDLYEDIRLENGVLMYKNFKIFTIIKNKSKVVQLVTAKAENGYMTVEMLVAKWVLNCGKECELVLKANNKPLAPKFSKYSITKTNTRDGIGDYYTLAKWKVKISDYIKKKGDTLTLLPEIIIDSHSSVMSLYYGKFVSSTNHFEPIYTRVDDYLIRGYEHSVKIYYPKHVELMCKKWDKDCINFLKSIGREDIIDLRYKRLPAFQKKNRKRGKIWLVSDRIDNAGDNGEVLFKYICEHKPEGVRPMFVIGSIAREEVKERLRGIGEVLIAEDEDYPLYFLSCEKIISSSAGEFTINPFAGDRVYYADLFKFKYYFMNHGVNCGDCSMWLNRFNKGIDIMFSTGVSERQNVIDRDYNYSPEQLVITGLARFDALYEDTKKQLLILPSWRRAYKNCYDDKTSSIYYDGFKETEYYKFYNGLINDERLLKVMREKGYNGLFCLHPIFMKQSVDFVKNDVFDINSGFVDYNKVFAESSLMVTDYSTIAFDFAYLSKPIVYTQFDKEEFYANQIYDECFDYEKEGFGPICTDLDSAVNELIRIIENDCKNDYIDRVNSFFVNHDKNNAKRILEAVLKN